MKWFYKNVPYFGIVALSQQAQRQARKRSISDKEIADALYFGKQRRIDYGRAVEFDGVQLKIIRPKGKAIDLVSNVKRVNFYSLWHAVMEA